MPLRYEAAIRQRLEEEVQGVSGVYGLTEFQHEKLKIPPCLYIVFQGAEIEDRMRDARQDPIRVFWRIVVAVRRLDGGADGQAARKDGQEVIAQAMKALLNWKPSACAFPFRYEGSPDLAMKDQTLLVAADFSTAYPLAS